MKPFSHAIPYSSAVAECNRRRQTFSVYEACKTRSWMSRLAYDAVARFVKKLADDPQSGFVDAVT
jgi:hypothetical protein